MLIPVAMQVPAGTAGGDEPVVTLRAYSNLVQIPVLVLSKKRLRAAPVAADQFSVSLDSGPYFAPRRVRVEGSDPIRLLLFVDVGPETAKALRGFGAALQELEPLLTAKDTISVSVVHGDALNQTSAVRLTPTTRAALAAVVEEQLRAGAAVSSFGSSSLNECAASEGKQVSPLRRTMEPSCSGRNDKVVAERRSLPQ